MDKYLHRDLYPDAAPALATMRNRKLAILSNGSTGMLDALVGNSGLDRVLDATISIDTKQIFKPAPAAYSLIDETLGVSPEQDLFVSSNPWDACGAKAFGLNVAWIERVTPEAMALACDTSDFVTPLTMFKSIRTQMVELGPDPDQRAYRQRRQKGSRLAWLDDAQVIGLSLGDFRCHLGYQQARRHAERRRQANFVEDPLAKDKYRLAPKAVVAPIEGRFIDRALFE